MARFYECVIRGKTATGQNVISMWYRDSAAGVPSQQDLDDVSVVFDRDVVAKYLAIMPNTYQCQEIAVYGYRDTWEREPYLPLIKARTGAGALTVPGEVPFGAIIYSAKVEPAEPSAKRDELNQVVYKPVRRGYWAVGPISESWIDNVGYVSDAAYKNAVSMAAFRAQLAAQLWDSTLMVTPLDAIRVGKPGKDLVQRGFGYVRDVVIRPYASTRRSRMIGRGA